MSEQNEDEKGYNGWTNYETWAVNLWLTDNQGDYETVRDMARHANGEYELSQSLKDMMGEAMPDLGPSLWSDMLNAAFSEVNWYELAEAYWNDFRDEDDEHGETA